MTERGASGVGSTGVCHAISEGEMEQLVWDEHLIAHWGAWKVYKAMRRKGLKVTMKMVRKVTDMCEVCAKFRGELPRDVWHSVLYSEKPGEVVYADVIGPLSPGRGGVKYIHCIVDSATRLAKATKITNTSSTRIVRDLEDWIKQHGVMKVLVTDNAAYYASEELDDWCSERGITHRFIAPYRHQSMGLVERYNRTLEDRLRKLMMAHGGSWADHLSRAVKSINEAVHSTTGYAPVELWNGTHEMRKEARKRTDLERVRRNEKRRIYPHKFAVG